MCAKKYLRVHGAAMISSGTKTQATNLQLQSFAIALPDSAFYLSVNGSGDQFPGLGRGIFV